MLRAVPTPTDTLGVRIHFPPVTTTSVEMLEKYYFKEDLNIQF